MRLLGVLLWVSALLLTSAAWASADPTPVAAVAAKHGIGAKIVPAALPILAQSQAEQNEALEGVLNGQIRPLNHILPKIRSKYKGKVLDAWLEKVGAGRWIYHLKLLQDDGSVLELIVNAQSGSVLEVKQSDTGESQVSAGTTRAAVVDDEPSQASPTVSGGGGSRRLVPRGALMRAAPGQVTGEELPAGPAAGSGGTGNGRGRNENGDADTYQEGAGVDE